jgi:hypothetical protein
MSSKSPIYANGDDQLNSQNRFPRWYTIFGALDKPFHTSESAKLPAESGHFIDTVCVGEYKWLE